MSEATTTAGAIGPILFVTGSPRSGTTLVARILRYYYGYGMGPEAHWVVPYAKRLQAFGDLEREENARRLIDAILAEDMFRIIREHQADGARFELTSDLVWDALPNRTYAGVVHAVLECVARGFDRSYVGCKNPGFMRDLETLNALFPHAKYLFVMRDGRDVALSMMEQSWGQKSWYANARFWAQNCERYERFRTRIGDDRQLLVRYEDVLGDADVTSRKIEGLLGRALTDDDRAMLVAELASGSRKDNYEKWRHRMKPRHHRLFESAAGHWLERFGYPLQATNPVAYPWERACFMGLEYGRRAWGRARTALGLS